MVCKKKHIVNLSIDRKQIYEFIWKNELIKQKYEPACLPVLSIRTLEASVFV